jgi:hypothetical protein
MDTLEEHQVDCTIVDYNPTSELNVLAHDNLTISGTFLPYELEKSDVTLTFSNDDATQCIPQLSNYGELVCLTQPFPDATMGQTLGMNIEINGLTVENDLSFTVMTNKRSGVQFNPDSASPVLKSTIRISLEADFPYELHREDFSINATSIEFLDETKHIDGYYRQMNVIDVDDATKTLVVKFGGAWSGDFSIDIRHLSHNGGSSYGLIDTSGLVFKVGAWVETVEPQSGSRFGGTLVTINGQNFGHEITDNPVAIST